MKPIAQITTLVASLAAFGPAAALAQPTSPAPVVSSTPTPVTTLTPTPAANPAAPVATAVPATCAPAAAPSSVPAPAPTMTYTYHFVPRQPDKLTPCQPQIYEVDLNSKDLSSSGDIDIRVQANQYVQRVTSGNGGRQGDLIYVKPGDFEANSKLPKLPFIARGMTVDLQFVGYGVDGRTVRVTVPVKLH